MDKFQFFTKRTFGLPPCLFALVVYSVLLVGLVAAILFGSLASSVLTLLLIPVVLTAFIYSRRLTLAMIGLSTVMAIWLALRISPDFGESLWTIGLSALAAVVLTETIRGFIRYREQAEAALARERDFAESLLGAAPMMIYVLDRDGRIVRMNRFAEDVTGYTSDKIHSVDWIREWVLPQAHAGVRTFLHEAFADPSSIEQGRVIHFIADDGSQRDIRWYVRIVPDLLNGQAGLLAMGEDVTERRRAAHALRESEARYRRLVENLGEGIGTADTDETFVFANPAAERIFGVASGELVGMNVRDFTDDEEFAKVQRGTKARSQGQSDRYELTIQRPDGDVRHLLLNATPYTAEDGTFIGSMGIFLDITARREAQMALRHFNETLEAEVAERTSELQAERARLQAILNSSADGWVVVDREGRITLKNPVASRWLGEAPGSEDAGKLLEAIRSMADRTDAMQALTLTLNGLDLRLKVAEIEGGTDDAVAVVSIHDVTALKQVNRIQSRFIDDVSHQLRTPTTTIKLYAEMLSKASEARQRTYQDALMVEADRLTQLVENILRLNSLESSELQVRAQPASLNDVLMQHQERCQQMVETHDLDFVMELDEDIPPVRVELIWLMDAVCRLVDNAVNYTPPGGQVTVSTGSAFEGGRHWATLSVTDTGVGIPDEELPDIFKRFYRGDYARDQQITGTGLGLAIVKGVANLHSGCVTVDSEVSKGSTFTMWLPAERT